MFTFVISLVVVVGAVAAVTALVVREMPQPATSPRPSHPRARKPRAPDPPPARAPEPVQRASAPPPMPKPRFTLAESRPSSATVTARGSRVVPATLPPTPWWRRIRSALALVGLVTALGVVAAVTIGAVVLAVLFAARQALG